MIATITALVIASTALVLALPRALIDVLSMLRRPLFSLWGARAGLDVSAGDTPFLRDPEFEIVCRGGARPATIIQAAFVIDTEYGGVGASGAKQLAGTTIPVPAHVATKVQLTFGGGYGLKGDLKEVKCRVHLTTSAGLYTIPLVFTRADGQFGYMRPVDELMSLFGDRVAVRPFGLSAIARAIAVIRKGIRRR